MKGTRGSQVTTRTTTRPTTRTIAERSVLGTGIALVLTLTIYGISRLAGADLVVTAPGQEAGEVPAVAVAAATIVGGALTLALALIVLRLPAPRTWFVSIAAVGLLLSFASPVGAAENTATIVWLCTMHVAVALAAVPPVLRALPGDSR